MIKNNNLKFVDRLTLYTSESCNLNCSYCIMAQQKHRQCHYSESQKVKMSFINGQYLNTLKTAFEKLDMNPHQIYGLDLWGQEPTLTLNEFSVFFKDFYLLCPNINNLFFSTNGTNLSPIINFINILENTINKEFKLTIQFSYDGIKNTKNQRKIEPSIITNNIKELIKYLNTRQLNNLKIKFEFHNVIDFSIIDYYTKLDTSDEEFLNYLLEFENLVTLFQNLNKNTQVQIKFFQAGLIHPFNASTEEGQKLAQFYTRCEKIGKNLQGKFWESSFQSVLLSACSYDLNTYDFILDKIYQQSDTNYLKKVSHSGCGFNYYQLKIRYDGTLVNCQNCILGLGEDSELEEKDLEHTIQKYRIKKNCYPNVLTDSDEELSNYFYQVKLLQEQSYILFYSQTVNLLLLLLETKQIDESYRDFNKLLKHAYYVSNWNLCSANNIIETGSVIGRTLGRCRFGCNGFLDIVEKYYDKKFLKEDF